MFHVLQEVGVERNYIYNTHLPQNMFTRTWFIINFPHSNIVKDVQNVKKICMYDKVSGFGHV